MIEFRRSLGSGAVTDAQFEAAREAVKQEHRVSCKTVTMRCHGVRAVDANDGLWELRVSRFAELNWTWEGARAFRLESDVPADPAATYAWSASVVEVDDVESRIFVKITKGERPCVGEFFVSPYDFLQALASLFNGEFAPRVKPSLNLGLSGALGTLAAATLPGASALPQLAAIWARSWSYLWGPPGTGKTFIVGRQVAAALEDHKERILVLSTTNKATDEVALAIGNALLERGAVGPELACRIGSRRRPEAHGSASFRAPFGCGPSSTPR